MDFDEIFEDNYKYIYTYALKLTGHIKDAEDLTQDVFLKAYSKRDQLKDEELSKYWLRKICLTTFLMEKRKKQIDYTNTETIDLIEQVDQSSIDANLIVEESLAHIQTVCFLTIINRMGPKQRLIFSLVEMFGMTIKEVSELLDMSISAVKSHLHRGRAKLDEELGAKCGLLGINNPCDCKAWEQFALGRQKRSNQVKYKKMAQAQSSMDKSLEISQMFKEMRSFIPSEEWYNKVKNDIKDLIQY